jgi:hypothetical protein
MCHKAEVPSIPTFGDLYKSRCSSLRYILELTTKFTHLGPYTFVVKLPPKADYKFPNNSARFHEQNLSQMALVFHITNLDGHQIATNA